MGSLYDFVTHFIGAYSDILSAVLLISLVMFQLQVLAIYVVFIKPLQRKRRGE